MKSHAKLIVVSTAAFCQCALAATADARPVTLTTTLKKYGGDGAYLAIYLTDAQGKVQKTLHVAGRKSKYHTHLRDWMRASGDARRPLDGVTGASVGSGSTLTVRVELADALIDAGYQIRIDSSVEDQRDHAAEVKVPLGKAGAGKPVSAQGYVQTFKFDM